MEKYTWNPVFNMVCEIKNKFLEVYEDYRKLYNEKYDEKEVYNYKDISDNYKNVLDYWIEIADVDKYKEIFQNIFVNQSGDYVLLKYDKYENIFSNRYNNTTFWNAYDGIYRECRTIVIDIKKMKIVACGFKKFFNVDENEDCKLDYVISKIKNCKLFEVSDKLDGSMQLATFYDNNIIMCGSSAIDEENSWRLKDGYNFMNSEEYSGVRDMIVQYPEYTFIFELIEKKDAHVVVYDKKKEGLYLIGIRNKYTGEQLPYGSVVRFAKLFNAKTTELYNKKFEEIIEDTKKYKSNEKEGYVIRVDDEYFKIKVDDYVLVHKTISKLASVNATIRSIADGCLDDFISKVPNNYKERVEKVARYVFDYVNKTSEKTLVYYEQAENSLKNYNKNDKNNKRDFMIWVDKNVPKEYNGYVKEMFYDNEINYLKNKNGKYKKLKDMGYEGSYLKLFEE